MQDSLFDVEPFRVEKASTPRPRTVVPVSGIRWRRTALVRDCAACWKQQADEYDHTKAMTFTRRGAVAELEIWDDDGEQTHHEFYCKTHAEKLGWDGSRSFDRKRRRNIEAEAKTMLAFKLNRLLKSARPGARPPSFDDDISKLVRQAGAYKLDMPEWTVTTSGLLVGTFHSRVKQEIDAWADHFGTDVDSEQVSRREYLLGATCRIIDAPATSLRVCGYTTAA